MEPINKDHSPPLETHSAISAHHNQVLSFVIYMKNSESPAPRDNVTKEIPVNLYKILLCSLLSANYFYC